MRAARFIYVLLIVTVLSAAAGCRGAQTAVPDETNSAPTTATAAAPGEGSSIADGVFEAAAFKGGEIMGSMAAESTTDPRSATARVSAALHGHPEWALADGTNPSTRRAGGELLVTYSFSDGSMLTLVGSPDDSMDVSRLQSVEVERR